MTGHRASTLAEVIADRLADPGLVSAQWKPPPWWRQSLAHGAPGIALLHIELATVGVRPWQRAHDWLAHATAGTVTAGADSHLFYGAPAVAHALTCAASQLPGSYGRALDGLDETVASTARRRLDAAHARIDAGRLPTRAEFDMIRGLAGFGAHLLRRAPGGREVRAVLEYLVRLTEPLQEDGETLPGWWSRSSPTGRENDQWAGGHANFGMAHGIAGPLALLALAACQSVTVDGHQKAILRICQWLDQWRVDTSTGPIWPYWINRTQFRAETSGTRGAQRPAWCYGVAGLARAQQLAALALGDTERLRLAGDALTGALADPDHRATIVDASLCHGYAGLAHLAVRVSALASRPAALHLHALLPGLLDEVHPSDADPHRIAAALLEETEPGPAFLEGATGVALAALAAATGQAQSGWDTCLLTA